VRRSGRLDSEATAFRFQSPYRCRDCEQRFWVVSRNTLFGAAAGFAAFAVGVIVWSGLGLIAHFARPAAPAPPATSLPDLRSDASGVETDPRVLSDALLRQFGTKLEGSPRAPPQP